MHCSTLVYFFTHHRFSLFRYSYVSLLIFPAGTFVPRVVGEAAKKKTSRLLPAEQPAFPIPLSISAVEVLVLARLRSSTPTQAKLAFFL